MNRRTIKLQPYGGRVQYVVLKRSATGWSVEKVFGTRREAKKWIDSMK